MPQSSENTHAHADPVSNTTYSHWDGLPTQNVPSYPKFILFLKDISTFCGGPYVWFDFPWVNTTEPLASLVYGTPSTDAKAIFPLLENGWLIYFEYDRL